MTTRLYALVARDARVGVVFRRGPSKQVLLIRWDLATDTFEAGQWLKGRIYERRCDLSPSGDRLVYFAAGHRAPLWAWTAVSRPPYLTAVALWPNQAAWAGGGLFETENRLLLNHGAGSMALHGDMRLPRGVTVAGLPTAGREVDAICGERMTRDGWTLDQQGLLSDYSETGRLWRRALVPEAWSRPQPRSKHPLRLRVSTLGINEPQGPWYVTHFDVIDAQGTVHLDLGRLDWADWDHNGDLVFARTGRLHRIVRGRGGAFDPAVPAGELIDLSELTFVERKPVPAALQWSGGRPAGMILNKTG